MAYSIHHTPAAGNRPSWYQLERWDEGHREKAITRARQYGLDHGGYICVKDHSGKIVFGTDPAHLDRAIEMGGNRDFTIPSSALFAGAQSHE